VSMEPALPGETAWTILANIRVRENLILGLV